VKIKLLIVLAVIFVSFLVPMSALAYYDWITGELRDSKTGAIWQYGADVEVFNCNTLTTIATQTVGSSGVFSINISTVGTPTPLCIEVVFHPGPNGTPGNAAKGPYPDRSSSTGTLNTGVYFTGTGPTAITLTELSARSSASALPILAVAAVLLIGSLAVIRRRR